MILQKLGLSIVVCSICATFSMAKNSQVSESIAMKNGQFKVINYNKNLKISEILGDLSDNNKRNTRYKLIDLDDDFKIFLPKNNIRSFKELKLFINANTAFDIYITPKTIFKKGVKEVKIRTQAERDNRLEKYSLIVTKEEKLSELFKRLTLTSNYLVSFDKKMFPLNEKKTNVLLLGKTAEDFVNNISNAYNLYFDVDYQNKKIHFYKYKSKNYTITTRHENFRTEQGFTKDEITQNEFTFNTLKGRLNSIKSKVNNYDKDANSRIVFSDSKLSIFVSKNIMSEIQNAIDKYYSQLIVLKNSKNSKNAQFLFEHKNKTLRDLLSSYKPFVMNPLKVNIEHKAILDKLITDKAKNDKRIDQYFFMDDFKNINLSALNQMLDEL